MGERGPRVAICFGMDGIFYRDPEHEPFQIERGPARALLIHGFMGTPRDMRPLAGALADAGVSTHGMLLPGFGREIERLPRVRAREWTNAALAAWEALQPAAERTTLVGFSMGGAVALQVAALTPHPPDQLILIAPHWKIADPRGKLLPIAKYVMPRFKPFGPLDFDNPDTRRMVAELVPGADLDDPAIRHRFRDAASIPTHALDELRRIGFAAFAMAPRIHSETTIVQGMQDRTTLPTFSRRLADRMGATMIEVPGDHIIVDPSRAAWSTIREAIVGRAALSPVEAASRSRAR